MASFNKVVLMGNVTRNPDVRTIPGNNLAVARSGIAVNRKYKDKDDVMFVDIVAFGKTAEIMGEYITKGSPILLEGRLSMNQWEQDGTKRVKHEVIIDTFQMLGGKKDRDDNYQDSNATSSYSNKPAETMIDEDDIPF